MRVSAFACTAQPLALSVTLARIIRTASAESILGQPSGRSAGSCDLIHGGQDLPPCTGRNRQRAQLVEPHAATCSRHVPGAFGSWIHSRQCAAIAAPRVRGALVGVCMLISVNASGVFQQQASAGEAFNHL